MRRACQSDLSDAEWSCLESHLPASKTYGRPRLHRTREILDAIHYVSKSEVLGWTAQIVGHPKKPAPEEVM